jgi:hypothetical protein
MQTQSNTHTSIKIPIALSLKSGVRYGEMVYEMDTLECTHSHSHAHKHTHKHTFTNTHTNTHTNAHVCIHTRHLLRALMHPHAQHQTHAPAQVMGVPARGHRVPLAQRLQYLPRALRQRVPRCPPNVPPDGPPDNPDRLPASARVTTLSKRGRALRDTFSCVCDSSLA